MKTRVGVVVLLVACLAAVEAWAETETFDVWVCAKLKGPGLKEKIEDFDSFTMYDNGTFTTNDIVAGGTYTVLKEGKKYGFDLAPAAAMALLQGMAAEYGVAIEVVSVDKFSGSASRKGDMIKGKVKIQATINVPAFGVVGAKLKFQLKFGGQKLL